MSGNNALFLMHLVMFDIDGTLTETMKVDEECFVRSFAEVFGFTDIDADWSHYPHVTYTCGWF
jgi:beta-phosphoglucomutase-like phosphatase (HAD superfamily)